MGCPCDEGAPDACAEHYQEWCGCTAKPGRFDWPGCGCERCEAHVCDHQSFGAWCPRCFGEFGWSWNELWSWTEDTEPIVVRRRAGGGRPAGVWRGELGTYGEVVEGVTEDEFEVVAALAPGWAGSLPELVALARAILALRP